MTRAPTKAPPVGVLPGVTTGEPIAVPDRWRNRACLLIDKIWMRRAKEEFRPFLTAAEELLEAKLVQLADVTGHDCGPIEASALADGAWLVAYGRYYLHVALEDPSKGRLVETASRLVAEGNRMTSKAYETAVRIAREAPRGHADPLAQWVDVEPQAAE